MTDSKLRRDKRLVDRLRAGELRPTYTVRTDIMCRECDGTGEWEVQADPVGPDDDWPDSETIACESCKGNGRVEGEPLTLVRVMALLGNEEAQELLDQTPGNQDVGEWITLLHSQLEQLPPRVVTVACHDDDCRRKKITHKFDVPALEWFHAIASEAVGQECLHGWKGCEGLGNAEADAPRASGCDACKKPRQALDACLAWINEPTLARMTTRLTVQEGSDMPLWVARVAWSTDVNLNLALVYQEAAKELGSERVRQLVSSSILARL